MRVCPRSEPRRRMMLSVVASIPKKYEKFRYFFKNSTLIWWIHPDDTARSSPHLNFFAKISRNFQDKLFKYMLDWQHKYKYEKRIPKQACPPFRTADSDSNTFYYSPYLAELQSAIGAAHGDRECLLKLACLSGKRLSALSGASAVAILLASTTDFMPEAVREPYQGW